MSSEERKQQQRTYQQILRLSQEHLGLSAGKERTNSAGSRAHRLDVILKDTSLPQPNQLEADLIDLQADLVVRLAYLFRKDVITEEEFKASVKRVIQR